MIITETEKKALRRVQADLQLNQTSFAKVIGISRQTLSLIIKDNEPCKVNKSTYQKLMRVIAEKY